MKKIDIPALGEGQQVWFNIGRLRQVEEYLKQPIGEILKATDNLSLKVLLALLMFGMKQNGNKPEQYYSDLIDKAFDNGYDITDIQLPVIKAVIASGIMGQSMYYSLFPEELTEQAKQEIEEEKN